MDDNPYLLQVPGIGHRRLTRNDLRVDGFVGVIALHAPTGEALAEPALRAGTVDIMNGAGVQVWITDHNYGVPGVYALSGYWIDVPWENVDAGALYPAQAGRPRTRKTISPPMTPGEIPSTLMGSPPSRHEETAMYEPNVPEVIERLTREAAASQIFKDTIVNVPGDYFHNARMISNGRLEGLYTALYLLHGWTDLEEVGDPESRGAGLVDAWRKQHGMFSDDPKADMDAYLKAYPPKARTAPSPDGTAPPADQNISPR